MKALALQGQIRCSACGDIFVVHTERIDEIRWRFPVWFSCENTNCPEHGKKYKIPTVELEEIKE